MGRYNEEMVKAGVMLSGDGLQPGSTLFELEDFGPGEAVDRMREVGFAKPK
jgi:hypothetical protein